MCCVLDTTESIIPFHSSANRGAGSLRSPAGDTCPRRLEPACGAEQSTIKRGLVLSSMADLLGVLGKIDSSLLCSFSSSFAHFIFFFFFFGGKAISALEVLMQSSSITAVTPQAPLAMPQGDLCSTNPPVEV